MNFDGIRFPKKIVTKSSLMGMGWLKVLWNNEDVVKEEISDNSILEDIGYQSKMALIPCIEMKSLGMFKSLSYF